MHLHIGTGVSTNACEYTPALVHLSTQLNAHASANIDMKAYACTNTETFARTTLAFMCVKPRTSMCRIMRHVRGWWCFLNKRQQLAQRHDLTGPAAPHGLYGRASVKVWSGAAVPHFPHQCCKRACTVCELLYLMLLTRQQHRYVYIGHYPGGGLRCSTRNSSAGGSREHAHRAVIQTWCRDLANRRQQRAQQTRAFAHARFFRRSSKL